MYGWMMCNVRAATSTCWGLSWSAKTKFTFAVTLKVTCKGGFYKYLTRSNSPPTPQQPLPSPSSRSHRVTFDLKDSQVCRGEHSTLGTAIKKQKNAAFHHRADLEHKPTLSTHEKNETKDHF